VGVASNDDSSATNTDSFIQYTVNQSAVFVVVPGTSVAGATGAYTLSVSPSLTASAPAPESPLVRSRPIPEFLRQGRWRSLRVQPRPAKL
jgi:hypothetical protein